MTQIKKAVLHNEVAPIFMEELVDGDRLISEEDTGYMFYKLNNNDNYQFSTMRLNDEKWFIDDIAEITFMVDENDNPMPVYTKTIQNYTTRALQLLAFQLNAYAPRK